MDHNLKELRKKALSQTKQKIKESVNDDLMIINAINNIEELEKVFNTMVGRLREWFLLKNPELEKKIDDNQKIVDIIILNKETQTNMGAKLTPRDEEAIVSLAIIAKGVLKTKDFLTQYLQETMNRHSKNVLALAGTTIGAKLIRETGSLKNLALKQSGTIQLLGAEKALFRHIKTGAKPPKYGFIVHHVVVNNASQENKGKAARALADKISLAARLDYFKGDFLGEKYFEELKEKYAKQ